MRTKAPTGVRAGGDVPRAGEPVVRWEARARSIPGIEQELTRIWAQPDLTESVNGRPGRHIAARTSVLNLVVIAGSRETGERAAATINRLTGRHPSRTLVVVAADPDGPGWLDARIQAVCVLPRPGAPETCAELIHLAAGGETGRRLSAIVAPLLVHDLPVTVWWPAEPPLHGEPALELLASADRIVVDGSTWSGDGLGRLRELAGLYDRFERITIRDFALVRQSRWRDAIASIFDDPAFLPYLWHLRRISVTYATHDATGAPGTTNVVKPVYHVAWLAARLGLRVERPLAPADRPRGVPGRGPGAPALHPGLEGVLRADRAEVKVVVCPVVSAMPGGTTLRVEMGADRRGSELRTDVTAEAANVHVRVWLDGVQALERTFAAPRAGDVELLAEALEAAGRERLVEESIRMAALLAGPGTGPRRHGD